MSEHARLLEQGLAGDQKARSDYEAARPIKYSEMNGWVKRGYDERVATIVENLKQALQEKSRGYMTSKDSDKVSRILAERMGLALKKIMEYESIQNATDALANTEKRESAVTMTRDPAGHAPVLDAHFKNALRQLMGYSVKATALEDFFSTHQAQLGEKEKMRIAGELESPWHLETHDVIKRILAAEKELAELFEERGADNKARALAVKWLALDDEPKTVAEIERLLWREKNKEAGVHKDEENYQDRGFSALKERYPGMKKEKLREMANLVLHLDSRQIQSLGQTLKMLDEHGGDDPHGFLKTVHDQAIGKDAGKQEPAATKPKKPPLEKTGQQESGGRKKPETPDQLLDRLKPADAKMTYPDHTAIAKMLKQRRIPAPRLEEAIVHDILFRVANHVKGSGTHAPNIKGIAGRFPQVHRGKANEIMHLLVNQGQLKGKKGSQTVENEALALDRKLRPKYYDKKTYPKKGIPVFE